MQYIDAPTLSTVPTLVLVHGSWHDGSCWSPVQEQLAEAGVRSIAPTLPGHGAGDDRLGRSYLLCRCGFPRSAWDCGAWRLPGS